MGSVVTVPNKLYRYNSFNDKLVPFFDEIKQLKKEQEKWKYAIFDGTVFPSSPLYFNDPYDCSLCIDSSFLIYEQAKKYAIDFLHKYCKPKKYDINRILFSNNLIEDMKVVLSHSNIIIDPGIDKKIELILEEHGSKIKQYLRVVCLSELNDSILMWSHYASNHTGFCIEYDLSKDEMLNGLIKPVCYTQMRSVLNKDSHQNTEWIIESALTKSTDWSYEKEWRIVIPYKSQENRSNEWYIDLKNEMKAIYLGAKAPVDRVDQIKSYFKNTNVSIYQMELLYKEYRLVAKELQ